MKIPRATTADVPKSIASEYARSSRHQAISEATGDGYTSTSKMRPGMKAGKSQFGLPRSAKSKPNTIKM